MDSTESKIKLLKNQLSELATVTLDTDVFKGLVVGATNFLNVLTQILDKLPLLSTLIGGAVGLRASSKNVGLGIFNTDKNVKGIFNQSLFAKSSEKVSTFTLSEAQTNALNAIKQNYDLSTMENTVNNKNLIVDEIKNYTEAGDALQTYAEKVENVSDITQEKFVASMNNSGTAVVSFSSKLSSAGSKLLSFGKMFLGTLGNMAIAMAASWAIGEIINVINDALHYSENLIKAGKEAKENIDSAFKSFSENKQSVMDLGLSFTDQEDSIKTTEDAINQVADKYAELRSGVNQSTNENISLSTDEYQQYIDLSSKLAEQFPELVSGYDSQGNAVLNLGRNADVAAVSIKKLYDAQKLSANVDMGKNLQTMYDGILEQVDSYSGDLEDNGEEESKLKDRIAKIEASKKDLENFNIDSIDLNNASEDEIETVKKILEDNGIRYTESFDRETLSPILTPMKKIDDATAQLIKDSYESILNKQLNDASTKLNTLTGQDSSISMMIDDQWRSLSDSISGYLQTSKTFSNLDESIQNSILSNISDIDTTTLKDPNGYNGNMLQFLYGQIIEPLSTLDNQAQKQLDELFSLDTSKLSKNDYIEKAKKIISTAVPENEDLQNKLYDIFGIDTIEETTDNAANNIIEAFKNSWDKAGPLNTEYMQQSLEKMAVDDITSLNTFIQENDIDLNKGFDSVIKQWESYKNKENSFEKSDTTLASILGDSDSDVSSSIDTLQSDISSLSDTLTKLKTGEFKDTDLTDLIQQFPQLAGETDNLQEAITNLQAEKLKSTLSKIDDSMVGASKEELENASKLKESLIKSVDLSDISTDKIYSQIVKAFSDDGAMEGVGSKAADQIMIAFGNELQTGTGRDALYKALLDPNIAKSDIKTIYSKYQEFLPTVEDFIQDESLQSQLTDYQDKYQALYQAQKDVKNGLMTGSTRKTFLDKFPDLAKYAGNTEDLSSAIDNLMNSMDSDVTSQFADTIQALYDAGWYDDASALQAYVNDVLDGVHDIEGAYQKIAGLKIPTPQYAELKDALESSNEGDLYNELFSQYKTAKEAWEKGEVGTDDFKTFASIISPTGVSDAANFGENKAMFERYFQDSSTGVENFLEDLQKLNLASNESGHWTSTLGNNLDEMKDAAQQLNMGFEPFMMMFGRLEDYGATTDFFSTEEEGQQHLSNLYEQIAEKKQKLAEIKADPELAGDQSAIDSLNKDLDELYARVQNTQTGLEEYPEKAAYYEKKNFEQAKNVVAQMNADIQEATEQGNEELAKTIEKARDNYLKENGYILQPEVQGPIQQGTIENPLAREFTNHKEFGNYESVIQKIQNATEEQKSSLQESIATLSQYSESELENIDLFDGSYTPGLESAEQALDSLVSTFGFTKEEALQLVAALSDMGQIKATPEVELTTLNDQLKETDKSLKEIQKETGIKIDMDFTPDSMTPDEMDKKAQELRDAAEQLEKKGYSDQASQVNQSADNLQEYSKTVRIQEITETDESYNDIKELIKNGDTETIQQKYGITVEGDDELKQLNEEVDKAKANNDTQIAMTVKLDESQLKQLLGGQNNEDASINVTANNKDAKKKIDEAKENADKSKGTIKIDGNSYYAISKAADAVSSISKMTGTIKVDANITDMVNTINSELNKSHTINVSANITTNTGTGSILDRVGKASGTALRIAHADGTAYNVLNYTPAHADGNVTLSHDETALVNEEGYGAESIVRDGKWMIIPGGAHFENLKKGDLIFNKRQTSELINSGRVMSGGGHARAYASGTGPYIGLNYDTNRTQVGKNSSSATDKDTKATTKHTDATNKDTTATKKSKKTWDWVAVRIKWWGDQVKKISDKITDYVDKATKQSLLKKQISRMNYQVKSNEKGAKAYMKKANSVAADYTYYNSDGEEIHTTVSDKYKKLVQKGAYRIEDMDTSTDDGKALAEAIEQYQTWYNKAQDCKQAIVDLKKEQMELFEQWANMPTEKAEQKLERLQNGFNGLNATQSRMSAVQSGGSTQKAVAEAAQESYSKAQATKDKAKSNLDKATSASKKASKDVKNKQTTLLKSKGLTNEQKKAIKSGKKIDTSTITNKTTKKRAESYNKSVTKKSKATATKKSAQTKYNTASSIYSSLADDANIATQAYDTVNELSYMDSTVDANVSNLNQAAKINNTAWQETKKNLQSTTKAKEKADKKVSDSAENIIKKYGKSLTDAQKKRLQSGKTLSTSKIKDPNAKKAIEAYNKNVNKATTAGEKVSIASDAEKTAATNAAQAQVEAAQATVEAVQTKFDNAKTYYEGVLSYQEKYNESQEKGIELASAHGDYEKSSDYDIKISNTQSLRDIKQNEVDELTNRLNQGVADGTIVEGSEEWTNMKAEIVDAQNAVSDYNIKIEELKQSQIGVYYEEQFDRAIDKLNQFKDRLDTLKGVISDDMKINKNTGMLTEWGATSLALNRKQFSTNQQELGTLLAKKADVQQRYNNGEDMSSEFGDKTYDEYMKDIDSKVNGLISSNSSLQSEALSLVKSQAQAELDVLNKVISKRKEALSAKKNYYDYDKTLKNKTKDIQTLERQIAALEGSTNAEDKARKAKLQEQLASAQEDLSDTITDHAYSMQSDALDKLSTDMSDDFEEWSNNISSNVEEMSKVIGDAVTNSALSNAQVLNNISTILRNFGLSDEQITGLGLTNLTGYASGTDYVPKSGVYRVNENGMESVFSKQYGTLTFLNQGDKVFNADLTKQLIDNAGTVTKHNQPDFEKMFKDFENAMTSVNQTSGDTNINFYIDGSKDAQDVANQIETRMRQLLQEHDKKMARDFKSLR